MQKPLTIRATFSIILRYLKEKANSEEFKKEILSISEAENKEISRAETIATEEENVQGGNEQTKIAEKESKETKKERRERWIFIFDIQKKVKWYLLDS